jgi:hypothetical protein
LARAGDSARAAAEAEKLATEPGGSPDMLYNCACVFALTDRLDKAVALLSKLRSDGYFDKADNLKNLQTDTDLDSLRRRDDFLNLVTSATKKAL